MRLCSAIVRWDLYFVWVLYVLLANNGAAAEPTADSATIEKLVKQLGSNRFAEREAATARLLQIGEQAFPFVKAAAKSPDAEIASRAEKLSVQIAKAIERKSVVHEFEAIAAVGCLAFSPDSRYLVTGGGYPKKNASNQNMNWDMQLWDIETGKELHRMIGHKGWVEAVAFSPDGKQILSAGYDSTVRAWDRESGKEIRAIGQPQQISALVFSPDGREFAVGGNGGYIDIWSWPAAGKLKTIGKHEKWCLGLAYLADGRSIVSTGSYDSVLRHWDRETGKSLGTYPGAPSSLRRVAAAPKGSLVVCSAGGCCQDTKGGTVHLWDVATGKQVKKWMAHPQWTEAVALCPEGRLLMTTGYEEDRTVALWELETGKELQRFRLHEDPVLTAKIAPNGKLAASAGLDGRVFVYRLAK